MRKRKTGAQLDREIDGFLRGPRGDHDNPDHRDRWAGSEVQSILFARPAWTTARARAWAKKEGHHYGDVDVTDDYVRLRQFDPTTGRAKRTITFGKGIKAVIEQVK